MGVLILINVSFSIQIVYFFRIIMVLSLTTLFLVGILHYYGVPATTTMPGSDQSQCNACCQGQPGLPGSGIPGVPGVPGIPGKCCSPNAIT